MHKSTNITVTSSLHKFSLQFVCLLRYNEKPDITSPFSWSQSVTRDNKVTQIK